DTLIWSHGKHNIRMGGELRRVLSNTETDPNARGTFSFTGYSTSNFSFISSGTPGCNPTAPSTNPPCTFPVPGTGYDFADFLLGLPQTTSRRFGVVSNCTPAANNNYCSTPASNYLRTWVTTSF